MIGLAMFVNVFFTFSSINVVLRQVRSNAHVDQDAIILSHLQVFYLCSQGFFHL